MKINILKTVDMVAESSGWKESSMEEYTKLVDEYCDDGYRIKSIVGRMFDNEEYVHMKKGNDVIIISVKDINLRGIGYTGGYDEIY